MLKAINNFFSNTFVLTCLTMLIIISIFTIIIVMPIHIFVIFFRIFTIGGISVAHFYAIYKLIDGIKRRK
jgi:hypothetical protein